MYEILLGTEKTYYSQHKGKTILRRLGNHLEKIFPRKIKFENRLDLSCIEHEIISEGVKSLINLHNNYADHYEFDNKNNGR